MSPRLRPRSGTGRPRRRLRTGRWLVALLAAAAAAAWWSLHEAEVRDETGRCVAADRAVAAWAARERLVEQPGSLRRVRREGEGIRWLDVERAYWAPSSRSLTTLSRRLRGVAAGLGLEFREERRGRRELRAVLALPQGPPVVAVRVARQSLVAVCMDDLGYRWEAAKRILALPCRLTCAIIPLTPHARAIAARAAAGGKEVFVHMPMQSLARMPDVPEYAITLRAGQPAAEVAARLRRAFAELPGAAGLNNHEGSRGTVDRPLMDTVMADLKGRGVVFLDSMTTLETQGWRAARDAGLRWVRRDVFLDTPMDRPAVEAAFVQLIAKARRRGWAIGIGHPHPATLAVLERRIPEAIRQGIVFVPVSALAARSATP